jgi:hypothetical protein
VGCRLLCGSLVVVDETAVFSAESGGVGGHEELAIGLVDGDSLFDAEDTVSDPDGEAILEVEDARLADVL